MRVTPGVVVRPSTVSMSGWMYPKLFSTMIDLSVQIREFSVQPCKLRTRVRMW